MWLRLVPGPLQSCSRGLRRTLWGRWLEAAVTGCYVIGVSTLSLRTGLLFVLLLSCGRTQPLVPRGGEPTEPVEPVSEEIKVLQENVPPRCQIEDIDTHQLSRFDRHPIDVLFVIDDSGSMEDDQKNLALNFISFIEVFQTNQIDFRLAAITTDMDDGMRRGKFLVPPLTNTTADLNGEFTKMATPGTGGSSDEQALAAVAAALSEPLLSTDNANFVRAEADLAVVFVGDEDDHSSVNTFNLAKQLLDLKGERPVTVAAAVGLNDDLFCWLDDPARWRIAQFAASFKESGLTAVCRNDYAGMLRSIAGKVVNRQCIIGLRRPISRQQPVHITVNGQPGTFVANRPDSQFPNGSIEVAPCLSEGSTVNIAYDACP